eukprot:sb/3461351/
MSSEPATEPPESTKSSEPVTKAAPLSMLTSSVGVTTSPIQPATKLESPYKNNSPTNITMTIASSSFTAAVGDTSHDNKLSSRRYRPMSILCGVAEVNGYLHERCNTRKHFRIYLEYKCPWSDQYYKATSSGYSTKNCEHYNLSTRCPNDPGFYQACGHGSCAGQRELNGTILLCGTYICDIAHRYHYCSGSYCETEAHCKLSARCDGGLNMVACDGSNDIPVNNMYDGVFENYESKYYYYCHYYSEYCKGFKYGVQCGDKWVSPFRMCNGESYYYCPNGEDEVGCYNWTTADHTTCISERTKQRIKIQQSMRCFLPELWRSNKRAVCINGQDQTNCSDPDRVAVQCLSEGYPTNISIWGYCKGYQLCDDNYNNECFEPEPDCTIHKGQKCDGHVDCSLRKTDEICESLTNISCVRRFRSEHVKRNTPLRIPLKWVMDGQKDCLDGKDEDPDQWKKCVSGNITHYINSESDCQQVLLCPLEDKFIDLVKLCDGVETCSFENELCAAVNNFGIEEVSRTARITSNGQRILLPCEAGGNQNSSRHLTNCTTIEHKTGLAQTVIDLQKPVMIILPRDKIHCSHLYGENYVYAACNKRCLDAECPLIDVPGDTCENKAQSRVRALTKNNTLTTLLKPEFHKYDKQIFPCVNKNCVQYAQVCDLKDDCGDGSDEKNCENNFKCSSSDTYLNLSQVCDGIVSCRDYSDECQPQCPPSNKNIFSNNYLRTASYIMGPMATVLNIISLVRSGSKLTHQETYEMFLNQLTILMINLGDLFIGVYLVAVSYFDYIKSDGSYCQNRYFWFSSTECSFLGVLSTTGSQLSLFAMTVLGITRVTNVGNLVLRDCQTFKSSVKLGILAAGPIMASLVVAITPVLSIFEDYFVNGLYYGNSPLFVGPVDKPRHFAAFRVYFGENSSFWSNESSWGEIRSAVAKMFSSDSKIKEMKGDTVHFYGNDGVCIFKYLVRRDDPQWIFSSSVLMMNCLCFLFISISYILIGYKINLSGRNSGRSGGNDRVLQIKILAIIITDFFCWIPLGVVAFLHLAEEIDATSWYPFFSILILPINSVINPFLYESNFYWSIFSATARFPVRVVRRLWSVIRKRDFLRVPVVMESVASGATGTATTAV